MSWTEERVALLKQLWGEGKTAAEIANHLGQGVTRNAVIGKAHRLKLSSRTSPVQQKTTANSNAKTVTTQQTAPSSAGQSASDSHTLVDYDDAKPVAPTRRQRKNGKEVPGAVKSVKMEALRERMCRWPIGDPQDGDFHFCGGRTPSGATYCKQHAAVAYQSSARKNMKLEDIQENAENAKPAEQTDDVTPVAEEPAVSGGTGA